MKIVKLTNTQTDEQKWIIQDWAGNIKFNLAAFPSFEDAEEFLAAHLGDTYETDRGEFEIRLGSKRFYE